VLTFSHELQKNLVGGGGKVYNDFCTASVLSRIRQYIVGLHKFNNEAYNGKNTSNDQGQWTRMLDII
jgi:hypothetical protein